MPQPASSCAIATEICVFQPLFLSCLERTLLVEKRTNYLVLVRVFINTINMILGCLQLSDFGLAKWAPTKASHLLCNDVVGTFG